MVKFKRRTLAGLLSIGILAGGCAKAIPQIEANPKPVEREVAQSEYPFFFSEPARCVDGGEQTYFERSHSSFAICSYDNPRFREDTLVMVEASDYDLDKRMDSVKIVKQHYGEKIENGEPIVFKRDGSKTLKKVLSVLDIESLKKYFSVLGFKILEKGFRIVDRLSEEMLRSLGEEDLNAETIYNMHEEDMEFLWGLVDESS